MIINQPNISLRKVKDINDNDYTDICNFFKDKIADDLKKGEKEFTVQQYLGDENFDWCALGLPTSVLYTTRLSKYMSKMPYDKAHPLAMRQAGIDAGWIFKWVIYNLATDFEQRSFERRGLNVKKYVVVSNTQFRYLRYDINSNHRFVNNVYAVSIKEEGNL